MRKCLLTLFEFIAIILLGGLLGATLVRLAPGFGTDEQELDSRLNHESLQALRRADDAHERLPAFYADYLAKMLRGDLGYSQTLQAPVRQLLTERFPETLKSVGLGLLFGWTLGLSLAAAPVIFSNQSLDLVGSLISGFALSMPSAVLALLFVIAHAPSRLLLGLIVFPKVFRYARNLLTQSASRPHIVTAWAKGLGSFEVFLKHILPLSAPPLFALAGVTVSLAFAAAIPLEVVCDLPGIGQLAWKAALGRDFELLVNLTMVVTAITLLANRSAGWLSHSLSVQSA